MKKLLLSIVMVAAVAVSAVAQGNPAALMKRLEKSNADIVNPKKAEKASTWIQRGDIFRQIADVNVEQVFVGQPANLMVAAIGQPKNAAAVPVLNIGGTDYQKYEYESINIYLAPDQTVAIFEEVTPVMEDAYAQSLEAYAKALEIDPGPKTKAAVHAGYNNLIKSMIIRANNFFMLRDFAAAYDNYGQAAALQDVVGDAAANDVYFQMAVTAIMMADYDKANAALDVLIERNDLRDGAVLYYAGVVKSESPELYDEAEAIFQRGIREYPNNADMLNGLINLYLKRGDDPQKVIPIIKQAQANDPKNLNLILQEGNAYMSMEKFDDAVAAYEKAIEIDPQFFNGLYNLGFAYYKMADKAYKELNEIDYANVTATKEKNDEVIEYRKAAIEPLEQAHQVDPKNKSVVELLQAISFSLRDNDPVYLEKYEKYHAINQSL